jgi:hypothetical protein
LSLSSVWEHGEDSLTHDLLIAEPSDDEDIAGVPLIASDPASGCCRDTGAERLQMSQSIAGMVRKRNAGFFASA